MISMRSMLSFKDRPSPWPPLASHNVLLLALALLNLVTSAAVATESTETSHQSTVRIAVFNVWELGAEKIDQVDEAGNGVHPQLLAAAEVIRRVRPDILLLNEIDYARDRGLAEEFVARYLRPARPVLEPIDYPFIFAAPVNTGVPSGLDLSNDGETDGPDDAWGFGRYAGQYGMALLSRLPIDRGAVRSFRALRWITMPGHLVFDGEEDRNGRRNFDEVRMLADYLHGGKKAEWMVDDQGRRGGLDAGASCLVIGDLNADPVRGDEAYGQRAIAQLLEHPRLRDPRPQSVGDQAVDPERGPYPGDSRSRTSGFGRIDYVLPSKDLNVVESAVFQPPEGDPLRYLAVGEGRASDHMLVWVDLSLATP